MFNSSVGELSIDKLKKSQTVNSDVEFGLFNPLPTPYCPVLARSTINSNPKIMNKFLTLSQSLSQKAVDVFNGKLTVSQPTGLKFIHIQLENLTQQFDDLESRLTAINLEERSAYAQQINTIEASIKHLEQLYRRLFSTTAIATVTLILLGFGMMSNRQSVANQPPSESGIHSSVEQPLSNR